jgi:hypothetical protein
VRTNIEYAGLTVALLEILSQGTRFGSQPVHRLFQLTPFLAFSHVPGRCQDGTSTYLSTLYSEMYALVRALYSFVKATAVKDMKQKIT